ncbi:hypothetical protein NHQ30_010537 [Ciborinia camelliae]|nr:hypothetical protein NHQ30_010537 [Ciborinia camelliae]
MVIEAKIVMMQPNHPNEQENQSEMSTMKDIVIEDVIEEETSLFVEEQEILEMPTMQDNTVMEDIEEEETETIAITSKYHWCTSEQAHLLQLCSIYGITAHKKSPIGASLKVSQEMTLEAKKHIPGGEAHETDPWKPRTYTARSTCRMAKQLLQDAASTETFPLDIAQFLGTESAVQFLQKTVARKRKRSVDAANSFLRYEFKNVKRQRRSSKKVVEVIDLTKDLE